MKVFTKVQIIKKLGLIILLISNISMYGQNKKVNLSFKEIDFSIGRKYRNKLIDTHKKALEIGLGSKKDKEFYKNNVVYLFNVGGGCFGASSDEISIKLENNIVKINWKEPQEPCPEVGEAMAFYGMIIISKKEHLNYKEIEFKYYQEQIK